MLHACAVRFDVTGNLEKFCELNKAYTIPQRRRACTVIEVRPCCCWRRRCPPSSGGLSFGLLPTNALPPPLGLWAGLGSSWLSLSLPRRKRKKKEEVHYRSLNFRKSLFFIPELQNWVKYIPQFLKPYILRPWHGYERFWRQFCLFHFYLFWLNICKIIVNHIKFIK